MEAGLVDVDQPSPPGEEEEGPAEIGVATTGRPPKSNRRGPRQPSRPSHHWAARTPRALFSLWHSV
jgi:hypothetical protein